MERAGFPYPDGLPDPLNMVEAESAAPPEGEAHRGMQPLLVSDCAPVLVLAPSSDRGPNPRDADQGQVLGAGSAPNSEPRGLDHNGRSVGGSDHNGHDVFATATAQAHSLARQAGSASQGPHHPSHDDGAMNRPLSSQDEQTIPSGYDFRGVNLLLEFPGIPGNSNNKLTPLKS